MPNVNRVILAGHLTRDPESRQAGSAAVVAAAIAVNRKWKNANGEVQEDATFVEFEAWNKTGELIMQYLRRGDAVMIEGRLQMDKWEDKKTGEKRSKLKVLVDQVHFLGKRAGVDGDGEAERLPPPMPTQRRQRDEEVPF